MPRFLAAGTRRSPTPWTRTLRPVLPWTGYGGVGDYRWANGNTEAVMNAAHGIRDGMYADASRTAAEESVDLVIVGGGFSGVDRSL